MLLLVLATLSMADIPPRGPRPPPCTAERCPEGTTQSAWCVTSLGKLPECAHTRGWTRACMEKAGVKAKHMMCEPLPGAAEPDPPAEPDAPAEAATESGWCQTGPAGGAAWMLLPLMALFRRRRRTGLK